MPATPTWTDEVLAITNVALVFVGLAYAAVTYRMLRKITAQAKSASEHSLASLSNQHNWRLLTFQGSAVPTLPCALPSWENLDAEDWKWRVLHLSHLNLFKIVWSDQRDGILASTEAVTEWMDKGRFIFSTCTRSEAPDLKGRKQLQQLLKPQEGYPKEFYEWLVSNDIIPRDFVVERRPQCDP